jgi:hypothetical protein
MANKEKLQNLINTDLLFTPRQFIHIWLPKLSQTTPSTEIGTSKPKKRPAIPLCILQIVQPGSNHYLSN